MVDVVNYPLTGSVAVLALLEYTYFGFKTAHERIISGQFTPKIEGDDVLFFDNVLQSIYLSTYRF